MTVRETVTNNPGKTLLASAGSVIAIVTALFTIDARYAHAADVEKDKQQTQRVIQETTLELRRQMLEDKLFELDVKQAQSPNNRLTPVDAALKERYQRQITDIARKQQSK